MRSILKVVSISFFFCIGLAYVTGIFSFGSFLITPNLTSAELIGKGKIIVAMGFGINTDEKGKNYPGTSNDSLLIWIANNTSPVTIIAQEGIILAKESENCKHAGQRLSAVTFVRMHEHNNQYVNTFEAARFALKKISSIYHEKDLDIVVAAHQHQLKRAVLNLKRVAKTNKRWKNYHFIVPAINNIPFDKQSDHIQTRYKYIYLLVETFVSRPRDFLSFIFLKFGILLAAAGIILFTVYLLYKLYYFRHGRLLQTRDEDRFLLLFTLSNSGIWLFAVSIIYILNRFEILPWHFTVLTGVVTGVVAGLRSMIFWNNTGMYEKKPALGEPVGAMGAGCFSLALNVIFGMILGWFL